MKKFILLLTSILLFNLSAITVSATDSATETETLSRANYDFLEAIGVLDTQHINFDDLSAPVTRAEFVSMAIRLTTDERIISSDVSYSDVTSSHWAADVIYTAAAKGIVSDAESFNPDATATLEQADKIAVRSLGYGDVAEVMGGWAAGYVNKAGELELNDGVKSGQELTKYDALCIIRNMAETDLVYLTSAGANLTYSTTEGETPLTEIHDIYTVDGIIGEDGVIRSNSPIDGSSTDKVEINGIMYLTGVSNAEDYLAQNVTAYYKDVDGEYTIVYVEPDSRNTVMTFVADDIVDYDDNVLTYRNSSGKSKTLKTLPSLKVIYNGERIINYGKEHIKVGRGTATFIDNDGDDKFDAVISYEYDSYYVENTSTSNYTVFDTLSDPTSSRSISLDPDEKIVRIYNENGAKVGFNAIAPTNVLTVFESASGNYVEVYISTRTLEMVITRVLRKADGTVMETTNGEVVLEDNYKGDVPMNERCIAYLNSYGNAVYLEYASEFTTIAYLMSYIEDENEEKRYIRILTTDDEYETYELAEKAKVNDTILKTENAMTLLNNGERQLIVCVIDDNDFVTDIYTPSENPEDLSAQIRLVDENKVVSTDEDGIRTWDSDTRWDYRYSMLTKAVSDANIQAGIPVRYYVGAGVPVCFEVPYSVRVDDGNGGKKWTEIGADDYFTYNMNSWTTFTLSWGRTKMYALKNQLGIGVIEKFYEKTEDNVRVVNGDPEQATGFLIVKEIYTTMNEEMEEVQAIMTADGQEKLVSNTVEEEVHQGDIILYNVSNKTKEINELYKIYCHHTGEAKEYELNWQKRKGLKGEIKRVQGGIVQIKLENGVNQYLKTTENVYIMPDGETPERASSDALTVGSPVVVYIEIGIPNCYMVLG